MSTASDSARNSTRTDVFRPDWNHAIRYSIKVLWVYLGFLGLCIFAALDGEPYPSWGMLFLLALLALFGSGAEMNLRRARQNRAVLVVGPNGVAFPTNKIDRIGWDKVNRVKGLRTTTRGMRTTGVRFYFSPGTIRRWQFGAFGRDRWEVMLSFGTHFGNSLQVEGGAERVFASIDRFHSVER